MAWKRLGLEVFLRAGLVVINMNIFGAAGPAPWTLLVWLLKLSLLLIHCLGRLGRFGSHLTLQLHDLFSMLLHPLFVLLDLSLGLFAGFNNISVREKYGVGMYTCVCARASRTFLLG